MTAVLEDEYFISFSNGEENVINLVRERQEKEITSEVGWVSYCGPRVTVGLVYLVRGM